MIVTSLDTFTSLIAGITIFGILGNLAHNMQIDDISKVVKSGTGLAFISYPDAISKFEYLPQVKANDIRLYLGFENSSHFEVIAITEIHLLLFSSCSLCSSFSCYSHLALDR